MQILNTIGAGADALWGAHQNRAQLMAPPFELESRSQAYAIQELVAHKLGPRCGWKFGLDDAKTTIAAPLYKDLTHPSPGHLKRSSFNRLLVEGELALVFADSLPPRDARYEVPEIIAAVESVHAAIEIVDSRFSAWPNVDPLWLLADGMSHGCFVLGSGIPLADRSLLDHGQYELVVDGGTLCRGHGAHPQGDPFASIAWLATRLSRQGRGIIAGEILTTGTFTGVVPLEAGQSATVSFQGIGNCSVLIEP